MTLKYMLEFPLDCYQGFFRQHAYNLSNQSFGRWLSQSLKRLGVDTAVGAMFLWIPYLLMRRCPRRWWLYTWMAATAATVFMVFITPVWIDPLFNKFSPLKDKALEADILALAERAGIDGGRVYEVEKSADTKAVNAHVTGFMGTKRIVLWDTIIAKLDRRELLTVMGHELGHYVLGHVLQGILLSSCLTFFGFYVFYRVSGQLIGRFKARFGFDRLSDIASWPLILLFFSVGNLMLDPFILAFSRHLEHEADRFALEITRDNRADATASVKLQIQNLSVPRPGAMYKLWRASHPSVGDRIDFANTYKPWLKGEAPKYAQLFKPPTKIGTNENFEP
jgi:Zn-dependent protease with chaperone function